MNIEFLNAKYSQEIMQRIGHMSSEVPAIQDHRDDRKNALKRTFMQASNVVAAKYGRIELAEKEKVPSVELSKEPKTENFRHLLRDVIIFDSGDDSDMNSTFKRTLAMMRKVGKVEIQWDAETHQCIYLYNDEVISKECDASMKIAKKMAEESLLKVLRENCFTIRSKLAEKSFGFKMLNSLGWKDESLDQTEIASIIDPINMEVNIGRSVIVSGDIEEFNREYFRKLLENFQRDQVEYDLVFSKDFSKKECNQIHK
jgi:hypothetical protein